MRRPDPGGSPPTLTNTAAAAGYWAGRDSQNTEPPGPVRLRPDEHPDAALIAASVAAAGWPVLAIWPGTKYPAHGGSEAANHADRWLTTPLAVLDASETTADQRRGVVGCQFATITGQPSEHLDGLALVALDLDGHADDLNDLLAEAGPEAEAWATETLRVQRCPERRHLWGTVPASEAPPTGRLAAGLEWRGVGGYVLLPGALHPSGKRYAVTGGRHEFTDGHQPDGAIYVGMTDPDDDDPTGLAAWVYPLPIPAELLAVVRARLTQHRDMRDGLDRGGRTTEDMRRLLAEATPGVKRPLEPRTGERGSTTSTGNVRRRLDGLARSITDAPAGLGNDRLNKCVGVAAAICSTEPSAPDAEDVRADLVAAYLARPIPPGESLRSREREALATVASGWTWGSTNAAEALADRRRDGEDHDNDERTNPVTLHPATEENDGVQVIYPESWEPMDLRPYLGAPDVFPTVGADADGLALAYAGRTHALNGPPETLKTWAALGVFAVPEMRKGHHVGYVDLEDEPAGAAKRLDALGCSSEEFARFAYVRPTAHLPLTEAGRDDERALLSWCQRLSDRGAERGEPLTLVVFDGLTALVAMYGRETNNNDTLAALITDLFAKVARVTGAAVLWVDHKSKAAEGSRYALGGVAKLILVSGVVYDLAKPPDEPRPRPGRSGRMLLRIAKDRPGEVASRAPEGSESGGMDLLGYVVVESAGRGHGDVTVSAVVAEAPKGPTLAAKRERIREVLRDLARREGGDVTLADLGQKPAWERLSAEKERRKDTDPLPDYFTQNNMREALREAKGIAALRGSLTENDTEETAK